VNVYACTVFVWRRAYNEALYKILSFTNFNKREWMQRNKSKDYFSVTETKPFMYLQWQNPGILGGAVIWVSPKDFFYENV